MLLGSFGYSREASGTVFATWALYGRSWSLFGRPWVLFGVVSESFWSHLNRFGHQKRELFRSRFQERFYIVPGSIWEPK